MMKEMAARVAREVMALPLPELCCYRNRNRSILASALQKSIRRGQVEIAFRAALTLLRYHGDYVWRRLCTIAMEDIGLANLPLVYEYLSLSGHRKWREQHGGEIRHLHYIITQLCQSVKDRTADDLVICVEFAPTWEQTRQHYAALPRETLREIVLSDTPITHRLLAAWAMAGTTKLRSYYFTSYHDGFEAMLTCLGEIGIPEQLQDIVRKGANKQAEPQPLGMAFSWLAQRHLTTQHPTIISEPPVALGTAGEFQSEAIDTHTLYGKKMLHAVVSEDNPIAALLHRHAPPHLQSRILGTALFRVEGGTLNQRISTPFIEEIRTQATNAHIALYGWPHEATNELLATVREHMPLIHAYRKHIMEGQ